MFSAFIYLIFMFFSLLFKFLKFPSVFFHFSNVFLIIIKNEKESRILCKNLLHCNIQLYLSKKKIQSSLSLSRNTTETPVQKRLHASIFQSILVVTVCSCHVTYAFQSESTLYSCLNVKNSLLETGAKSEV